MSARSLGLARSQPRHAPTTELNDLLLFNTHYLNPLPPSKPQLLYFPTLSLNMANIAVITYSTYVLLARYLFGGKLEGSARSYYPQADRPFPPSDPPRASFSLPVWL